MVRCRIARSVPDVTGSHHRGDPRQREGLRRSDGQGFRTRKGHCGSSRTRGAVGSWTSGHEAEAPRPSLGAAAGSEIGSRGVRFAPSRTQLRPGRAVSDLPFVPAARARRRRPPSDRSC
jgi:hypothetical protein